MKPISLTVITVVTIALAHGLFAQNSDLQSAENVKATLSGSGLVAQVADGAYRYCLLAPTQKGNWVILRDNIESATNDSQKIIYSGEFPFKPQPSTELLQKLGTPDVKSLISQWVSSVVANGKDATTADFQSYYKKNGKPKYTGLTAEAFRSQGVDPEAPPKDSW